MISARGVRRITIETLNHVRASRSGDERPRRQDVATTKNRGRPSHGAHCPQPFARYGHTLEDFGRYRRAGVNLGIGTDVAPHNLIEEMRLATVLARIAARDITAASVAEVFHAATVGGADALGRPDLGRLIEGAKADLVLVDLACPWMRPARDPLRSLVFTAADRAVKTVYVHGEKVMENGRVLTLDHAAALDAVTEGQRLMVRDSPANDWSGREAAEIFPISLPQWDDTPGRNTPSLS